METGIRANSESSRRGIRKVSMLSLANAGQPYGSTIRPLFLGNHLVSQGVEMVHICDKLPSAEGGPKIISLEDYVGRSWREKFRILREHCLQFSPDLIYSHQVNPARIGVKLSRICKCPHVYDAHSSQTHELSLYTNMSLREKFWRIAYEAVVLRLVDKIIVPSPELKDYFVRTYRIHPGKIRIVKNGVETNTFCPARPDPSLRESLGIPPEVFLIVFTSPRLASFPPNEMGLRLLFGMIPEIERRIPGVRFLILGGGPELIGPSSNIIYTGYVKSLQAYVNLANVCIAPYPPQAICGGTRDKICEYLACGKPIVATKEAMRGFDDAVPDEHFLLAGDDRDFVSKLEECARNSEMAAQLGCNARKLSEKYSWSRLAAEVLEVFGEAKRT